MKYLLTGHFFWNHRSLRTKTALPKPVHPVKNPGTGLTRLVFKQIVLGLHKENRKKYYTYRQLMTEVHNTH